MQEFNYHAHTYRCGHADLDMKDEDYIKEYIKMGFKEIIFTDHCPQKNEIDKRNNMRMKYSEKDKYLKSIKFLNNKYKNKIKIGVGYEVEYLEEEENNILDLKNESDKIILGQHFVYGDDKQLKIFGKKQFTDDELFRYTKYIEKAIELNIPDIIAHPDIYMLNRKEFGNIEKKVAIKICELAEKHNIPLEINLNNIFAHTYYEGRKLNHNSLEEQKAKLKNVFYPCKEFWEIVTKYNIKVLYGIDSHHRGQILLWKELLELAKFKIGEEIIRNLNFIEN